MVSKKLSKRSRKYFHEKWASKTIIDILTENIREAIDNQIIDSLKKIASEINKKNEVF